MSTTKATSPIKAVFFDIGGVVIKSPLIAIHAYEREKGLPKDWINVIITRRGKGGAWQRFERGELELYPFYTLFGQELSDTGLGNQYYREWCQSKNVGESHIPRQFKGRLLDLGLDAPTLPESVKVDGREASAFELFGRMMRSTEFDPYILGAIHKLRETKQFKIVALTNNYSAQYERVRDTPPSKQGAHKFSPEAELEFLGWGESTGGPGGPKIRALFDDFVDSSVVGSRKPEPGIYQYACKVNGVNPEEVVFLDDLGLRYVSVTVFPPTHPSLLLLSLPRRSYRRIPQSRPGTSTTPGKIQTITLLSWRFNSQRSNTLSKPEDIWATNTSRFNHRGISCHGSTHRKEGVVIDLNPSIPISVEALESLGEGLYRHTCSDKAVKRDAWGRGAWGCGHRQSGCVG
ncbi:Hydrolase domain-containing protein [Rhizoctonia solani AG-1 IA]|uniref:Hydrolase domain-containing protein n=1 Tax=Thanatephorus cucumeris (strain AG1-IA) TaxID=983506 RepID=L8WV62_THACA|nr:Hydrolase domain-containing protein [Rhizoctonia solani AG-1 IA]